MKIKTEELREFLKTLTYEDFQECSRIKKAHTSKDVEFFKINMEKLKDHVVIKNKEPFLVDLLGNDLTIAYSMNRKYKTTDGRVVYCKQGSTVIKDCRKQYGSPLNGYWAIPTQFLTKDTLLPTQQQTRNP